MAGLIGQNFGRYQILERLGEGGMATVYKAYDTRLEREVAIKVIRREAFPPEEMDLLLKRFERESKSLAKLSHPNIVGVIDYGEYEGLPYLVMVYLPGGTLKNRLGQPMPWREAVQMILPVAHALEYVHEHNIINRDVKPSNILLTDKGQPMLTDFGLVKLFGEQQKDATLTSSGTGLGTPDYMAPEQWTGEPTAQSDLYSLGVVLYEMITGHRPYVADTPAGVLLKQATEPLPLPKLYVPDLPKDVESVLLKALAKEPKDRYPDMHVFVEELQNLLAGREVQASSIKTSRLRDQMTGKVRRDQLDFPKPARKSAFPILIVAVIGIVLFFAAGGGYWLWNNPQIFAPVMTPTQQVLPSPTEIPPTKTAVPPTVTPTVEPSLPTATSIPSEIRDSRNVPMILIPAGTFNMGSDDTGDVGSRPAQELYLDAFYIDKFEVTNEMYDACVFAVECRKPQQGGSATRNTYFANPVYANFPVLYVDWKMASAYCKWRGGRLPTEAEWEKAARGTDGRLYPWGNQEPDCSLANHVGCVADTTPVDQHKAGVSPYGVYGMAGNVWEWTSTLFRPYPYKVDDGREDQDVLGERIARGGSWHVFGGNTGNVRADTRMKLDPGYFGGYVGFRCALPLPE
ncbi:eukaryotic-like serine/threonine-protein kinase [Anaerolineales bacterium]|nr:eukaryotic-like serine/threonine-protein kinase [Anaerolineales bacterium]